MMSDLFGADRRFFAILASLVVAAMMASVLVVPPGQAFTATTIDESVGDMPVVSASLSHEGDPGKGEKTTFHATTTLTNTSPNTVYHAVVTVTQDPHVPFTADPVVVCSHGAQVGSAVHGDGSLEWSFPITNITGETTCSSDIPAQVSGDVDDGRVLTTSISMKVEPQGQTSLIPVRSDVGLDESGCAGVAELEYAVPEGMIPGTDKPSIGTWFLDIKFAEMQQGAKARILPLPTSRDELAQYIESSRPELTEAILDNAVVNNEDSTKPLFGVDPLIAEHDGRFVSSINFPYDPNTWTGKVWLQPGDHVTVRVPYQYTSCTPFMLATNGDIDRTNAFGAQFEQARKMPEASNFALDYLIIGGKVPPKKIVPDFCKSIYLSEGKTGHNDNEIGVFNPIDPMKGQDKVAQFTIAQSYGGVAVSDYYPGYFYAMDATTGGKGIIRTPMKEVDPDTGAVTYGPSERVKTPVDQLTLTPKQGIVAFAPDHTLWFIADGYAGYSYKFTLSDDGSSVKSVERGPNLRTYPEAFMDASFTSDGDMVLMTIKDGVTKIYQVPKSVLDKPAKTATTTSDYTLKATLNTGGSAIYGSAFGPDGKYYFSNSTNETNSRIYVWDGAGTNTFHEVAHSPAPAYVGMASCWFGDLDAPEVTPGKLSIRKSAIDPNTGIVAPAGGDATAISLDGGSDSVTVEYVVSVINGTNDVKTVSFTDSFVPPTGFTIREVTYSDIESGESTNTDNSGSFTVDHITVDPSSTKSFKVTVTMSVPPLKQITTHIGECNTDGKGTSGTGFFNSVTMDGDEDGEENNDSCIPVTPPPSANVTLHKVIVDQDGKPIDVPEDLSHFQLTAAGKTDSGSPLSAFTGSDGVSKDVVPGNYMLGESMTSGDLTGYYQAGDWSCEGGALNGNVVTVADGANVTCTVTNTRTPRFSIRKYAGDTGAQHTIDAIKAAPRDPKNPATSDYVATLTYHVNVSNLSDFAGYTGPITDQFVLPAGLLSDGDITVAYNGPGTIEGGKTTYTIGEFTKAGGATLATSVKNLGAGDTGSFVITIPVRLDFSQSAIKGTTVWDQNATKRGECDLETFLGANSGTTNDLKGTPNGTSLDGEYIPPTDGSGTWYKDNFACVPVTVDTTWTVEKSAQGGQPGETGTPVTATPGDNGSYDATVTYSVKVTNSGAVSGIHPEVADSITVPDGWTITDVQLGKQSSDPQAPDGANLVSQGNSGEFTIPAGTVVLPKGESDVYTVKVTAHAKSLSKEQWTAAGECRTEKGGTPGTGFFNKVTLDGDTDGEDNNDACVPVKPASTGITIIKTDGSGKLALPGAEFSIYSVNPSDHPGVLGTPLATKGASGDDAATFIAPDLQTDKDYWLVETKAPLCVDGNAHDCFSLLPEPLKFKVTADGEILPYAAPDSTQVITGADMECNPLTDQQCDPTKAAKAVGKSHYILKGTVVVADPRSGTLPVSGGHGPGLLAAAGSVLIALAALGLFGAAAPSRKRA